MEQGARALAKMIVIALVAGLLVIALNSAYRQALICQIKGTPADSPIWKSNLEYYSDIGITKGERDQYAK